MDVEPARVLNQRMIERERRLIVEPIDLRRPKAGGIDTCIRGLIKYCPDGLELRVVGIDAVGGAPLGRWIEVDVDGRRVQFMAVARADVTKVHTRIPHVARLVSGLARFRRRLGDVDTVQSHRLTTGYALRRLLRGRCHVQFVHNDGVDNLNRGSESYFTRAVAAYRFLERSAVVEAIDVVVFNRDGADRLRALDDKVRFSPTWFDDEYFRPAVDRVPLGDQVRVLTVGRIDPSKDPVLAVRGIGLTSPRFSLTMVGTGGLMHEVEFLVDSSGLASRIDLLGAVPKARVADIMREHDMLLMTSQYEGYPRTVVEALACGLPVVTTHGGEPNGLVVEGVNGARIDGRDPADVAAAIERGTTVSSDDCVASVLDHRASTLVPVVLGRS